MPEETKQAENTIADVLDINKALNGIKTYGARGEVIGYELQGVNYIKIPEAKFSISQLSKQIKGLIESYQEELKALQMDVYEFDEKTNEFIIQGGKNVCKEGKTVKELAEKITASIKKSCGEKLKKLPKAILIKHPEILPKHLEYLASVLDGSEDKNEV